MAKYYQIAISRLVDTFSRIESGKTFDFVINTSETSISDSTITQGDVIIAKVDSEIYYKFEVINKTVNEIQLKKVFEIQKLINYSFGNTGEFKEITEKEFNFICSKLFEKYNDNATTKTIENKDVTTDFIVSKKIREFAFEVFKFLKNEFGESFLIEKSAIATRKLSEISYEAYIFPDYFKTQPILGSFPEEQSEESLKTSNTLRFFPENLNILAKPYIYFTTQWGFPDFQNSPSFISFNQFVLDYSNNKYRIEYNEDIQHYKLVLNDAKETITQIDFSLKTFQHKVSESGLIFPSQLTLRFVASLCTKPFVICSGLSGSGKTKLAQAFVQWICQDESQYRIIPVGADWTNREPLLGYPNALKPEEYVKPDSGVLDLIIQANRQPDLPHFLILDEMNLSHVERYFADFLSVMESKKDIPLYAEGTVQNGVPAKLKVPSNLFIIGTVNIDETTNMFSPKVLDRANTIEFRVTQDEMENFLSNIRDINMEALTAKGAGMAKSFLEMAASREFATADIAEINAVLVQFFGELKKTGAEFGYRSATEILRLIHQLTILDNNLTTNQKIDIAIMQKLLPKLHGSRRKLCPVLETLGSFCITGDIKIIKDVFEKADFDFNGANVLYPLSLEKITRMYRGAIDNGFASFAEA